MGQSPEHQTTDETRYPGFSQGQSDSGSSHYTDSPEFQIPDCMNSSLLPFILNLKHFILTPALSLYSDY